MDTSKKQEVIFTTSDPLLQKLMTVAETRCKQNIDYFDGRKVLVEGGGYKKIWLETQPMGGAMYAKRDLEAAKNNQLLFMENQREDGRLPGSITCQDGKILPQYDKLQGFCFPEEAFDLYYLLGKDKEYLTLLFEVLVQYDKYLWKKRDSDKDGCLETWCRFDTGEDNAVRYGDAPNSWDKEQPPDDRKIVPIASMDVMSYSYSARKTAAKIANILGYKDEGKRLNALARNTADKIHTYLWDDTIGALFDRSKSHAKIPILIHNTLRTMYWGSISQYMAERFVKEHLLNPNEFWTKMPLPSVSISDPYFRNVKSNNWSGQCEALTYQRAIRALENYGFYKLIPKLGICVFRAIGKNCHFVQQFDPFTMEPSLCSTLSKDEENYGPAILSVMEYCSRMYGVWIIRNSLVWGTCSVSTDDNQKNPESSYEQIFGSHSYRLILKGNVAYALIDGKKIFEAQRGIRIITDMKGKICSTAAMESGEKAISLRSFV